MASTASIHPLHRMQAVAPAGEVRVGRIVEVRDGRPEVEFGPHRAVARVALAGPIDGDEAALRERPVLLVLENGDASLPIIVGWVTDTLPGSTPASVPAQAPGPVDAVEIDGRRIAFEGREEVVLRCGEASITLRADGQVVLKGTRVTSRASETNKIRGATVQIN